MLANRLCSGTIALRVVQYCSVMFEAIFICDGVPFLGVKGLSVVHEDFQGHSFEGTHLSQAVSDHGPDGRGHLEQEGVFAEII